MDPCDPIIKLVFQNPTGGTVNLNVHQGVLCKTSEFFRKAIDLKQASLSKDLTSINLSDEDLDTVKKYIKWLYTNEFPIELYKSDQGMNDEEAKAADGDTAEKVFIFLAKAYVFGEQFRDTKYKNAVLRNMFKALKTCPWQPGPESVKVIYKGTPPNSPLRRLIATDIAYMLCECSTENDSLDFFDAYPRRALADALKATIRTRGLPDDDLPTIESFLHDESSQDTSMQEPGC
ncbi:hypothetical protein BM1_08640 [Bipolaris maydis]|nr:hypothetical protein BM1_08640 [Bipolaris maydis]